MRDRRLARAAPAVAALVAGLLALGPALRPGYVLRYDMVFVPDPPLTLAAGGFPRAVPSDLLVALLAHLVPAAALQKIVLVGLFVLAGSGAAALVPGRRTLPKVAAAVFYAWNVYLAQRLLLGQWALLLGVAGLPWAVRAAARGGPPWRVAVALLPAAAGGFQAMLVSALAVLPVAATRPAPRPARLRGTLGALAVIALLSLPWAVPALRADAVTDPAGVAAFAPRADGPFGALGGLLGLGGIWNAQAEVPGQAAWWLAAGRLAVAAAAVAAFAGLPGLSGFRSTRPEPGAPVPGGGGTGFRNPDGPAGPPPGPPDLPSAPGTPDPPYFRGVPGPAAPPGTPVALPGRSGPAPGAWPDCRAGLLVAAAGGLAVALAGAYAPGLVGALIAGWPGFGPLRDGQLYIAPLAVVQAVGFGLLAGRVTRPRPGGGRAAVAVPAVVAVLVPVLLLPGFAWGAAGRLAAVRYPAEWRQAQRIVNGDPRPGALLSLPWGAHRAFGWNGGRVILDPATKAFARRVLWNDSLTVADRDGRVIRVGGEDREARRLGAVLAAGTGPLTPALRAAGVRYVLVAGPDRNTFSSRLPGATAVLAGGEVLLLRL
ncbi:hypothetical protein Sru01_03140 [Sphaerisporangium rufum]|uniref:Uncharacterized protein n=1 Tax=Sphaerisporangium rufum TaxID=1381558 RepID=A0A919QWN4_9ACTN|nr:hypothetical protein [Sphaerisporangium rufum]GII75332.1 hypothetical protein Sru01_03140 [Sphaerisporangium rufum]